MTDGQPQGTLALRLSIEELMLLLGFLKIKVLPGIQPEEIQAFLSPENATVLRSAQHTLQARSLITLGDDDQTVTVDQTVATLLLNCAAAHAMLAVLSMQADAVAPRRSFFDISPYFIVEHSDPEPGVYRFVPLPDLKAMTAYILTNAGVDAQPVPDEPSSLTIATDWLQIHREALQQSGPDAGVPVLLEAGAPQSVAEFLHILLSNATVTQAFLAVDLRVDTDPPSDAFSLIHSLQDTLWLARGAGEGLTEITQVGAVDVANALIDLLRVVLPELFPQQ
jgi:hypothetical protein